MLCTASEAGEDAECLLDTERHPDPDTLRERVEGHDPDDQQGLPRLRSLERAEVNASWESRAAAIRVKTPAASAPSAVRSAPYLDPW